MFNLCSLLADYAGLFLLAQEKQPLIQRLDGATRAKVLAALGGLILLGFALVLLTWLGGRVTRRYMRGPQRYQPPQSLPDDDWIKKR